MDRVFIVFLLFQSVGVMYDNSVLTTHYSDVEMCCVFTISVRYHMPFVICVLTDMSSSAESSSEEEECACEISVRSSHYRHFL
jgi:hypothetical protein